MSGPGIDTATGPRVGGAGSGIVLCVSIITYVSMFKMSLSA